MREFKLTPSQMLYLKEQFKFRFKNQPMPAGGNAEIWLHSVLDLLEHMGLELKPKGGANGR